MKYSPFKGSKVPCTFYQSISIVYDHFLYFKSTLIGDLEREGAGK